MLKEERFSKIINLVNDNGTMKTTEISEILNISLATVRRDLNELDSLNKLKKVFGGANSIKNAHYITKEDDMVYKKSINMDEKRLIGKYAASLIKDYDFVYMDAGTSVAAMIPYIRAKNLNFMTNSISIAKELSNLGHEVFILPGIFKLSTESLVGATTSDFLKRFNFTIGFFGSNGIHKDVGFTTPDIKESLVKERAILQCKKAYVLADSSKFGKISQVTFSNDPNLRIITCKNSSDNAYEIYETNYKELK